MISAIRYDHTCSWSRIYSSHGWNTIIQLLNLSKISSEVQKISVTVQEYDSSQMSSILASLVVPTNKISLNANNLMM
jgi:hypothetical protein